MKRFMFLILIPVAFACSSSVEYDRIEYETPQIMAHLLKVEEPGGYVFTNRSDWISFWDEHVSEFAGDTEPPEFDFTNNNLAGIFWPVTSGCFHEVEAIQSVENRPQYIAVKVGPLPDLGACRMIVYPYQLISLPDLNKPVHFTGQVPY